MRLYLPNEAATHNAAQRWATRLQPGDCLALSGPLGAGKSVFARALMRALGVREAALPSPTFSLIELYETDTLRIAHMDWYRLGEAEEVWMLGVLEYFAPPWISIVEWSERAPELLPRHTHRLRLCLDEDDHGARWLEYEEDGCG